MPNLHCLNANPVRAENLNHSSGIGIARQPEFARPAIAQADLHSPTDVVSAIERFISLVDCDMFDFQTPVTEVGFVNGEEIATFL